ncbi:MAG: hypothetical protein MRY23_01980 [Pelagibacteraceae bacterium]|nr:hypothetical protein [Pelagibacteraceae bacterium]MCI5079643.1 hypothetical protein [Pelagibacteraceae bacterium]
MDKEKTSHINKSKKLWIKGRKSLINKTNPNNRYFMRLIKKATEDFLSVHGEQIKKDQPKVYYSMINRPLPKKYQKEEVVKPVEVKPSVPDPVRENELVLFQKKRELERKAEVEKIRNEQKESMKLSFSVDRKDPNCGMRFVSAYSPVNTNRFGHSQSWKYKEEKKRSYYW